MRAPHQRRQQRGFTLVEVLAALLFLAIAMPAILGALSAGSRVSEAAERTTLAGHLAENQLAALLINDPSNPNASAASGDFGADFPGYRWELKQEQWATSTTLTQLTMQVFFSVHGQERSVSLCTLLGASTP